GPVDYLIYLSCFETTRQVDESRVGDWPPLDQPGELPVRARDDPTLAQYRVTHSEPVIRAARIDRRLGILPSLTQWCGKRADRKYKVRTDRAGDHGSSLGRNRRVQSEQSIPRRNVKLPSDPNQREPLPHQEAIAKLGVANGSGRTARVVEERDQRLSAAVGDLNQGGSIASIRLFRSEDVQIGGKLYLATLTARSF